MGDLVATQPLQVAKDEHLALRVAEPLERARELDAVLRAGETRQLTGARVLGLEAQALVEANLEAAQRAQRSELEALARLQLGHVFVRGGCYSDAEQEYVACANAQFCDPCTNGFQSLMQLSRRYADEQELPKVKLQ